MHNTIANYKSFPGLTDTQNSEFPSSPCKIGGNEAQIWENIQEHDGWMKGEEEDLTEAEYLNEVLREIIVHELSHDPSTRIVMNGLDDWMNLDGSFVINEASVGLIVLTSTSVSLRAARLMLVELSCRLDGFLGVYWITGDPLSKRQWFGE